MLQLMNFFPVHYFVWRCGPSGPLPTPAQVKTQLGFMEPELWLHRRCSEHLGILTHFKVKNCTNSFIREVYYYEYHYLHQWRRKWQPNLLLLPGKFHGWRSLVGYSPWGCRVGHDWATSLSLSHSISIRQMRNLSNLPRGHTPSKRPAWLYQVEGLWT